MRLWPRTLGRQLIVVTASAVMLSNVAVAIWFEFGNEQLSQSAQNERMIERAAETASVFRTIPARSREAATTAISTPVWHFTLINGKANPPPKMSEQEMAIAQHVKALLPPQETKYPVSVKFITLEPTNMANASGRASRRGGPAVQITMPVVRNVQLVATYLRPPSPPWRTEIVAAAVVAVLAASAAAAYIARRVALPLSKLAAAATVAAAGREAPRVPEVGPLDVRNAAAAFNSMMDQVKRTLESQRQLLSAVGHDLRTPITAIRINLEFVEDVELRERLEKNLNELQELTEAVLSAAKGTGGEQKRNVDLAALIDSVCADLDDIGEPVQWQQHKPAPLACRPNEIRRAVRNLVENAVAYGRKADVQLAEAPTAYEIVVEDEGPGIPEADQARVFEPFVRLEGSRNVETGGTGLGLTLVKAIAEGHGGTVILENRTEGGLRARIRLPREAVAA